MSESRRGFGRRGWKKHGHHSNWKVFCRNSDKMIDLAHGTPIHQQQSLHEKNYVRRHHHHHHRYHWKTSHQEESDDGSGDDIDINDTMTKNNEEQDSDDGGYDNESDKNLQEQEEYEVENEEDDDENDSDDNVDDVDDDDDDNNDKEEEEKDLVEIHEDENVPNFSSSTEGLKYRNYSYTSGSHKNLPNTTSKHLIHDNHLHGGLRRYRNKHKTSNHDINESNPKQNTLYTNMETHPLYKEDSPHVIPSNAHDMIPSAEKLANNSFFPPKESFQSPSYDGSNDLAPNVMPVYLHGNDGSGDVALPAGPGEESNNKYASQSKHIDIPSPISFASKSTTPQSPLHVVLDDLQQMTLSDSFFISEGELEFEHDQKGFKISLGNGTFGEVYKGVWHYETVAIKKIKGDFITEDTKKEFYRESSTLVKMSHPNIVRLFGVCLDNTNASYYMVMEYMSNGSLFHLLHNPKQELTWKQRYLIALDIAKGLFHVHTRNIMHRDLKSLNVLLNDSLRAKICDFGLSRVRAARSMLTKHDVGTPPWMAPELFTFEEYTEKADIYSYGIILWEIATRRSPYFDTNKWCCTQMQVVAGQREEIPDETPAPFANLIIKCWHPDKHQRPTIQEVMKDLMDMKPIFL